MRSAILGALGAICLAACGGGGPEANPPVQIAQNGSVAGTVYEIGGQTVDRSGVIVRVRETGAQFVTDLNGAFRFANLAPGTYTLEFDAGLNAFSSLAGNEEREDDGEGDGKGEGDGEGKGEGEGEHDRDGKGDDKPRDEEPGDDKPRDEEPKGDKPRDEEPDHDKPRDEEPGDDEPRDEKPEKDDDCDGDDERETDKDGDEHEDGEGNPKVDVPEGGEVDLRVALAANGDVVEFSKDEVVERFAMDHLYRAEGTDVRAGGKVSVAQVGERERIKICVHCLEPETVVTFHMNGREQEPALVGDAVANADGVACFERDTGENQNLPLNAESLDDLAGNRIEVHIGDDLILVGEVPDLPREGKEKPRDEEPGDDKPRDEEPDHDGDMRGKALLDALVDGVEGEVAIRCWPREEIQAFKMVIEGLEPGDLVAFEIQDRENGDLWVKLGTREASEGGRAFYATGEGDPMPFGVESVRELIELRVRIRRDEADDDTVLMLGRVPGLVED